MQPRRLPRKLIKRVTPILQLTSSSNGIRASLLMTLLKKRNDAKLNGTIFKSKSKPRKRESGNWLRIKKRLK